MKPTPPPTHTPTPWRVKHSGLDAYIVGGPENFPCANMPGQGPTSEANAAHIVKCVNAHDELVATLKNTCNWLSDMAHYSSVSENVRFGFLNIWAALIKPSLAPKGAGR